MAVFGNRRRRNSGGVNLGCIVAAVGLGMLLAYIIPVFALFVIVGLSLIAGGIFLACKCRR